MSIPKEPRQLMINLMYLVLTAMLALNVSAKIINAFFSIEKGISASNKIMDQSNTILEASIENSTKQAEKYKPLVDKAQQVRKIVSAFNSYVEGIRTSLVDPDPNDNQAPDPKEVFFPLEDKQHPGYPKNFKNKEVTTRILVDGGKGEELKAEILKTREALLTLVNQLRDMKIEGTSLADDKLAEPLLKELQKNLTLDVDDQTWRSDGEGEGHSWAKFNFDHMPVAALWPMLTKFQNDAKSSEAAILNFLAAQIGATSIKVDAFIPISSPEKSYLLEGETFVARIGVGASSKSFFEGVTINAGGSNLNVVDGEGEYRATASGVGEKTYHVRISVKNPATGKDMVAEKDFKYEVGKGSAAVELDKMNVVYIGVENPISVSVAGVSSNKVSVSASGGGLSLTPDGNSHYIAKGTTPTMDASITVVADGKQMVVKKVKVKRIPDPVAKLGGKMLGGKISPSEMKAQMGIGAVLENFDFDAKCDVVGFEMFRVPKRTDPTPATNKGARFEGSARSLVDAATFGDLFLFENVKVRCPGDAAPREINTLSFQVK